VRRSALLLALCATVAGCGSASSTIEAPPATTSSSKLAGGAITPPDRAQPIALHDAHGHAITLAGQRGRWTLVTFLYTHCPDVCPLIASNLNTVLRARGPTAKLGVLAVSVDPKGDTPAAVRAYERRMHLEPGFHFLIGTRAQLRRVWAAWHVLAVQQKPELVDHVAYTALIDPKGRRRVLYDSQVEAQQVLHDLRLLQRRAA
jgi:protein SCO1